MNTSETGGLPAKLEAVQRRFQEWRGTHKPRSRLPDALWAAAAKVAEIYGLHRTSRALRVEYYSLKKRVPQAAVAQRRRRGADPTPQFLELAASLPTGVCDCTVELEDTAGSKMRVHLKAARPPDLTALCRSFWNPEP